MTDVKQKKPITQSQSAWEYAFTRSGAAIITLTLFASLIWAGWFLEAQQTSRLRIEQENELLRDLSILRANLESALNAKLYLVQGISAMVHANPKFSDATFQKFARELGDGVHSLKSLQLASKGVVSHVWPYPENKQAIGHDLLADPGRREAAEKAIISRDIWLAGPLNLLQGGEALIGRLPIFLNENDQDYFWGFASILIDFPLLLEEIGLSEFANKNQVAIRGRNGKGADGDVFLGDASIFNNGALLSTIQLPAGQWQIASLPKNNWSKESPNLSRNRQLIFFISMLISLIAYSLLRIPSVLRRAVSRATEALSKSERRFRDAIEALPDGFAIFEADQRLAVTNKQLENHFHAIDPNIGIGNRYEDLWNTEVRNGQYRFKSPEEAETFLTQQLAQHARREQNDSQQLEKSDGSWLQISESLMRDGGLVAYYRDITELVKKEQQLIEEKIRAETANRAKSDFLATISHELRTPLNAVLGLLGLLKEDNNLNTEQQEFISTAHSSATHLLSLLNELLDISKMEADKLELEEENFSLLDILSNAVTLLSANAKQKSLLLEYTVDPQLNLPLIGDQGRIRQIILNLLGNAIKFTDTGSVKLNARCLQRHSQSISLEISISDTGIGFNPALSKQLFEPFSQADSSAVRRFSGTGLGLAICKRLVEKMQGEIWADSTPGEGSVFTVHLTLPLAETPIEVISNTSDTDVFATPRELGWGVKRILLAEDNATNQLVIQAMLKDSGYQIDIANNGLEAIQAVTEQPVDLILMDVQMPQMDGLTATKVLRGNQKFNNIPIIGLSANAMSGYKEDMLSAGMNAYLTKPVNKQALINTMHRCLSDKEPVNGGPSD
ncbi:Autoinducer 2 sensor kinase/phosphatase LuxQ [Zhongshania aliphaticivorans]|uniref:histidine kinase n=1 Tax=Zhongshania aliphaticivorans TaxID=1470434 RepID=A0A5S9NB08_9GAMM|nr:ATP-binding protein [Zhongshania aliphaticivorans]CAA0086971.1 Autoinducer 2 sensor kinase/phosphatase LuxQ [Zhongshania aliphaticivorans]CAA0113842.1 Autoinducer 2 sensor kinase/phosphatase LuxQ [Zhongshania aliphaticivorans]